MWLNLVRSHEPGSWGLSRLIQKPAQEDEGSVKGSGAGKSHNAEPLSVGLVHIPLAKQPLSLRSVPSVYSGLGGTAGLPLSLPHRPCPQAMACEAWLCHLFVWGSYPSHNWCRPRVPWVPFLEQGPESANKPRPSNSLPRWPRKMAKWGLAPRGDFPAELGSAGLCVLHWAFCFCR